MLIFRVQLFGLRWLISRYFWTLFLVGVVCLTLAQIAASAILYWWYIERQTPEYDDTADEYAGKSSFLSSTAVESPQDAEESRSPSGDPSSEEVLSFNNAMSGMDLRRRTEFKQTE
jgi:hypothetical protein